MPDIKTLAATKSFLMPRWMSESMAASVLSTAAS